MRSSRFDVSIKHDTYYFMSDGRFKKSNFISEWNKQNDAMHMLGMYEIHLEIVFR